MKKIYFLLLSSLIFSLNLNAQAVELDSSHIHFGTTMYGDADSIIIQVFNLLDEEVSVEPPQFFDVYNNKPFYVTSYPSTIPANGSASFFVVFKPIQNIVHNSEMVFYTSGHRGAVSLDLIGDCEYPMDYYASTHNLADEALETALHTLLAQNYQDYGYSGARDKIFMQIDNQKVNGQGATQNTLTRIYIGTEAVGYTSRSDAQNNYSLNTEHTFPQGNFNSNLPMKADMHHLFAADINANGKRSNYGFGNVVSGITWSEGGSKLGHQANGATVFEPRDEQKGPAARAILYFVVRYQNYNGYLTEVQEQTLREWSREFPPNEVQKKRNEDVYSFQHNRNPFVDYPQLLDRIYNIRLNQNRPAEALLSISTDHVDFDAVVEATTATYNVVLTNYGNEDVVVSGLALTENSTASFDFGETLPASISITPGESYSVPVTCYTTSSNDDLEAYLHFTTTAQNNAELNIPVTASFLTGLADIDHSVNFTIVPNPATSKVELQNIEAPISFIQVYDITGRLCIAQSGSRNILETSSLKSGLYQVLVRLENGTLLTQKLVKQ